MEYTMPGSNLPSEMTMADKGEHATKETDVDPLSMTNKGEHTTEEMDGDTLPMTNKGEHTTDEMDGDPTPTLESSQPLKGFRLFITLLGLCFAVFCVALDNTIIATAIPYITDQFKNLNDVGWYGSVYLLTTCAFQLLYGKLYRFFSIKWVFLSGLFIFEVGSLICGVAPNSISLIVGRAIAGFGSAAILCGAMIIIAHIVAMERVPVFISLIGGMYGIASVVGPLLGGVFTEKVTWRWCFYINLPLGVFTAVGLVLFLRLPRRDSRRGLSTMDVFKQLDPIGTLLFVPAIICLLLALQWAGTTYAWRSWRMIFLFIMFGLLLTVFIAVQIWEGEAATVPPRIARQRSVAFGAFFAVCLGGTYYVFIYYLPIWFQAIKGVSPLTSGIDTLPMILGNVLGVISAGALTTRFGYYMPFIFLSLIFMSIGAGLLTTLQVDSSTAKWIGYQILFGLGSGWGFQQTAVAAQTVLALVDIPTGTAIMVFIQLLGGAMFVTIAQSVFTNHLVSGILAIHIPNLNPTIIVQSGATHLRDAIPTAYLPEVLVAYNAALVKTFQVALCLACLSLLGAVGMEWRSVKNKNIVSAVA